MHERGPTAAFGLTIRRALLAIAYLLGNRKTMFFAAVDESVFGAKLPSMDIRWTVASRGCAGFRGMT